MLPGEATGIVLISMEHCGIASKQKLSTQMAAVAISDHMRCKVFLLAQCITLPVQAKASPLF